jgi:hypothetical protein
VHTKYPIWRFMAMRDRGLDRQVDEIYLSSVPELLYESLTGIAAVSEIRASGRVKSLSIGTSAAIRVDNSKPLNQLTKDC